MLERFVLSAVLLLSRAEIRADQAWVAEIARDIAAAASEEGAPVVFEGPAAREATALMLVAIAAHESGFQRAVDRCEKRGDGGRSRTLFQLIGTLHLRGHGYAEVCGDRRLAARLALGALVTMRTRWPRATPLELTNAYSSGRADNSTPQGLRICHMWQTRAKKLGLEGAECEKRGPIGFQAPSAGTLPDGTARGYTSLDVPSAPRCPEVLTVALASTLLVQGVSGCDRSDSRASHARDTSAAPSEKPAATARRPTRRYYLGHTPSRCEVYSVDDDQFSAPTTIPCPPDLQPGERIRIMGKTCMRESTGESREQPVVCPDPLTNLEKRDRAAKAR